MIVLWSNYLPKKGDTVGGPGETLTVSIILTFQGIVLITTCYSVMVNFKSIKMSEVFSIYYAKVIFFGTAYILCYIREHKAFHHPAWFATQTYPSVCMSFMYYSMSTMTLTGQGDIWPATILVEAMSMIQYCLGVSYTIFTISQAVDVIAQRSRQKRETSLGGWWKRWIVWNPTIRKIRKGLRRVLFLIVAVAQSGKIIYFGTTRTTNVLMNDHCTNMEFVFFMTLDIAQLLIIIFTSSKMINWDHKYRDISLWFLVQSYLACAVIFAGIYIDIQAASRSDISPFDPTNHEAEVAQRSYPAVVFEFLHFALATQTAVGVSGNLEPRKAEAYLLIMIQMGHSFIFHTYIFGLGRLKIRMSRMSSAKRRSQFLFALTRNLGLTPSYGGSPRLYGSTETILPKSKPLEDDVFHKLVSDEQWRTRQTSLSDSSNYLPPCTLTEPINTRSSIPVSEETMGKELNISIKPQEPNSCPSLAVDISSTPRKRSSEGISTSKGNAMSKNGTIKADHNTRIYVPSKGSINPASGLRGS